MQSQAEKKREAWLHRLRSRHEDTAHVIQNGEVKKVQMENPHLVEDDGTWRLEGEYNGHMVSRFVKPPPQ